MLQEKIRQKKSNTKVSLKEFELIHSKLQTEISFIDFAHFHSLFLGYNEKVLQQKSTTQQKKFNNLLTDKKTQHDPKKIIFNYSSCFIKSRIFFSSEGFKF